MKKQIKQTEQTKNYTIQHEANRDRFAIITNYHLLDARLTLAEKGFLTCLMILPNNWKITQKATAAYFNISEKTFFNHIRKLKELGYIEVNIKSPRNTEYIIKEKPSKAVFDAKNIKNYTIQQLNEFLNDKRIEQRYKALIKKALGIATETNEQFNKLVAELEEQEQSQDAEIKQDNNKLPF